MNIYQWLAVIGAGGFLCLFVGFFTGNVSVAVTGILGIGVVFLAARKV